LTLYPYCHVSSHLIIGFLKFLFTSSCCRRFLQIMSLVFVQPWEIVELALWCWDEVTGAVCYRPEFYWGGHILKVHDSPTVITVFGCVEHDTV
jgi:hypothetical protein